MGRYDGQREQYDGFNLEDLSCYGCVYSNWSEPPPGKPSGADPCQFCVRNRLWRQHTAGMDRVGKNPQWPDGTTPVCIPMDAYHSIDFRQQAQVWIKRAQSRDSEALERLLSMHDRLHPEG